MPQQLSYPGVYIQEVASGVRTITSVSTSVAAFVDFFKKGTMNEPVQIFGMADFEREFGGLDTRSRASYAIAQFFLNGGSEAYVVRVAKDGTVPLDIASMKIRSSAGADILEVSAANAGAWGNNLRVDIGYNTADPDKYFNLAVTLYDSDAADAAPLQSEVFLNLSVVSTDDRYVETILDDESKLVSVKHVDTAPANVLPAATGLISGDISGLDQADFDFLDNKTLKIKIDSVSATAVDVDLADWTAGALGDVTNLKQLRAQLEKSIREVDPVVPAYAGATVELVGEKYFVIKSGTAGSNYSTTELITVPGSPAANRMKLTSAQGAFANVQEYELGDGTSTAAWIAGTAGSDGEPPGPAEIVGSKAVEPYKGMYSLDYVDIFNILCIPRAIEGALASAPEVTSVISNALTYCREKRAFMIIDIPENVNEIAEIKDWLDDNANFRHDNAAVYFPRLQIPDPKNDYRLRSVGASGTMAGIYARTDANRGVWKTPAGIEATLTGVSDLDVKLTDMQNGTLNPLGINCLRTFPIYGSTTWGGRTTQGADAIGSEWKYIAVRRLALMIEESLFRGTKWVVFEPNDEPLWAKIRMNIGSFMQSLFRQGAFQGTAPKDAYFVKCDKETTTQDDINKGIVNIQVGFAPLKPAEFVVISIQQIAGDV